MPSERNRRVAQRCLEKGYATPQQVGECLKEGDPAPIEDVLRGRGYISDLIRRELAALDSPVPDTLKRCGVCATVHAGDLCPKCAAGFLAEDEPIPPERPAPPLDPEVERAAAEPQNRFGKYVLLKELGAGGMGVVFKAWQSDLRRVVALKFIRGVESLRDRERFFREAQLAATLNHPGIAPVYESGVHEGKHFFAMQYVEGVTLERWKAPSLKEAVERLARVAEAVAYAHELGIIHRDLKPANVMIDSRGRAYVMDFGLAKSVRTGSSLTGSGFAVGTPSYMSPEQARGRTQEIGPRSDVYSLGAILYELAAGRPPFVGDDVAQLLVDVAHSDPTPPRTLKPSVPADLETVALKALEKDPGRRYASAEDFAADLRRWLDGEPVLAKPAGAISRVVRKLRKHKLAAAGLTALAAGLLAAAGAWALRAGERRTRADAKPYYEEAFSIFDSADKIRLMAKAPDDVLRRLRSQLQRAEINAVEATRRDPEFADAHYLLGRVRRQLRADRGEEDLTRAIERDPAHLRAFMERALLRLDVLSSGYGLKTVSRRTSTPLPQFTLHAPDPRSDALRATILADLDAASRLASRDFEKALLQGAADLAQWRPGEDERLARAEERLHAAGALAPDDPSPLRLLALARLLRGDFAGAADQSARAIEIAPNDHALLYYSAGPLLLAERFDEALAAVERALRINPDSGRLYNIRGSALTQRKEYEAAYAAFQEALKREPKNDATLCNLGYLCYRMKRFEEAVAAYGRAAEIAPSDPDGFEGRAVSALELGRFEEAERDMERVIALRPDADAYANRGAIRSRAGRHREAAEDYAKALEIDPKNAGAYFNLGILRQREGKPADAVIAYSKAIELGRVQPDAYSGLAKALIKTRRYAEAEEAASKAIELGGANYADRGQARTERGKLEEGLSDYLIALKSAPDDGGILRDLGLIHLRRGRPADALPYLRKARDVGRKDACPLLGDCLLRLGRLADSDAAFTEAVDALPQDHLARFGRARTRQALGRRAEAIADLDAALALAPSFAHGYALRGTLKLEEERHDEAAADLKKAVDLEPALAEPLKDALKDARREP